MTTFKFEPTSGLWSVYYETTYAAAKSFTIHGGSVVTLPQSNNFSICSIFSEKDGVKSIGLCEEAKAIGLYGHGEDAHMTVETLKAKAVATECNLYIYESGTTLVNLNDSLCDVLSYSIADCQTIVDNVAKTIEVRVAHDTVVTALVPTFTLSNGATAKISNVAQVSASTAVNLGSAKDFVVTSSGGVTHKHFSITAYDCSVVLTDNEDAVIEDIIGSGDELATYTPYLTTGDSIPSSTPYYYGVSGNCVADASDDIHWIITVSKHGTKVMPNFLTIYECGWSDETGGALETSTSGAYTFEMSGDKLVLTGRDGWAVKEAAENNLFKSFDCIEFHDVAPKGTYTISRTLWDVSPAKILSKAYDIIVTVI